MKRLVASLYLGLYLGSGSTASELVVSFDLPTPHFSSGNLATAAYPRWETVAIGPIPAIAGAVKLAAEEGAPALKIVAVMSQDRTAHAFVVAKKKYNDIKSDPVTKLPGQKVLLTRASTGRIFAEKCFAGWGLALDQVTVVEGEQAEIRQALATKVADVAFVWSPSTYVVEDGAAKAGILPCIGTEQLEIPTVILVRADLLSDSDPARQATNRKRVATTVAQHLGAWAKAENKPVDAAKRLVKVYAEEGIKVTQAEAGAELQARQPEDLEGQRIAFAVPTGGGQPPIAVTLEAIMDFMVASGTLSSNRPNATDLIDSSILEDIAADAELTKIAHGM